ncbi:MAG: YbhN family protein [Velocimicrobium sp.]
MNKRKGILNIVLLMSVFLFTMYYIFEGEDIGELRRYIQKADSRYWLAAVVCVVLFIGGESVVIYYMMHTIKQKIGLGHCFLYSFVGFFFSCITPSASGGQPAQLYYMRKDKIPMPIATLVLMIVTITYKSVLVMIGFAVMMIRPTNIMYYLHPVLAWCYLGLILNVVSVSFMLLIVFHPTMAKSILSVVIKILNKMHLVKQPKRYFDKFEKAMQQYQEVAVYFRTHKLVVWNVLAMTIVQRLLLFYVTYLTLRSFHIDEIGMATIVVLQGMISVAVDMLPLPGGMGMSEKLFLAIFTPICGNVTLPAMVVSRGLSFYTQLIISAVLTIVAHLVIGKERKKEGKVK